MSCACAAVSSAITLFACSAAAPQGFELELLDAFSAQIGHLAHYRDPRGGVARGCGGCPFCHEYPVGTPVSVAAAEKRWPGKGEVRVKQSKNDAAFEFPQQITADSVSVTFAKAPAPLVSVHCLMDGVWCPVGCKMAAGSSEGGTTTTKLEFPFFVPFNGIKIEVIRHRDSSGSGSSSGCSFKCSVCKSPNCGVYCAKCHSFRNEVTSVVLNVDKSSLVSVDSEESASTQREELEAELGRACLLSFRPFVPN